MCAGRPMQPALGADGRPALGNGHLMPDYRSLAAQQHTLSQAPDGMSKANGHPQMSPYMMQAGQVGCAPLCAQHAAVLLCT